MEDKGVEKAYVLLVTIKAKPGHGAKFKEVMASMAAHVEAKERKGTLAYRFSTSEDDPDSVFIYERYISKEYLNAVHKTSQHYKELMASIQTLGIEFESFLEKGYYEDNVGFSRR